MCDFWLQLHFLTAAYMTGIIFFVQRIQYPMLPHAHSGDSGASHREYTRRMGLVVGPVMLVEMCLQLAWIATDPSRLSLAAALLLALIWVSTFTLQVPAHQKLCHAYNEKTHRNLVRGNWIRTLAWTARTVLIFLALTSCKAAPPPGLAFVV